MAFFLIICYIIYMRNLVCFTGGGTTGHVSPGCAVIESLREKYEYSYLWIGSRAENEKHILERFAVPYISIPAGKLRRYFSLKNITDLFKIGFGFIKAFFILVRFRPLAVFSKGGYVSFPVLLAAKILKIPSVSHESDLIPGLATRLNSRLSDKIILGFSAAAAYFPESMQNKLLVLGNPVRKEIFDGNRKKLFSTFGLKSKKPVLLVMGGSQGAKQLNDLLSANIETLLEKCIIIHQCGKTFEQKIHHPDYICRPFFNEEFADALAGADIVVSRAGASSLFEIAALRKPSIIIPLSLGSSRGDQIKNAAFFSDQQAAVVLENPDEEIFLARVEELLKNPRLCKKLSEGLSTIAAGNAAEKIAGLLHSVISEKSKAKARRK